MKNKPKVSVIIPVYNGAKNLKETIESILNQTFKDFEVIVIDDCSTDNSREIVTKYFGSKVKLIVHQKNMGGPAPTKNTGINEAKGEYLAFTDHDDIWFPTKLEKQIAVLEEDKEAVANFTNGYILNNDTGENIAQRWGKINEKPERKETLEKLLNQNFILSTTSALIRKSVIAKIGGFDDKMKLADDYEMWLRLANTGRLTFIFEPLFQWRYHLTSLSHNEEKHLTDLIYIYEKFRKSVKDKEYDDIIQRKLSGYYKRLGNYYLANKKYEQAKASYNLSLENEKNQRLLKIILVLFMICPFAARIIVKNKRNYSQSIAKIDPEWTLINPGEGK